MEKDVYEVESSARFIAHNDPPVFCTMCAKKLTIWDMQEPFGFDHLIGYGSSYDMRHIRFRLCCNCFDKVMDWMRPQCRNDPVILDKIDWYTIRKEDVPLMEEVAENLNNVGAWNLLAHLSALSDPNADGTHQYLENLAEALRPIPQNEEKNTTDL